MCSLSWREPKSVKRPVIATVGFVSPFQLMTRQLTLKPSGRKPPDLGPKVRVDVARLNPGGDEKALAPLIGRAGLRDVDKDGLLEQDTAAKNMWRGTNAAGLNLEFELPEPVPIAAIEVWNYNGEWETADGIRKADVAVSPDGTQWETVLRGADFAEAAGVADYDEPIQLKLNGATARKVRFQNIVPWNDKAKVGLSKVVFHQAQGPQAAPRIPEDGGVGVSISKGSLDWISGQGATEHKVFLGTSPDSLALIGTTSATSLVMPELKPDSTYFWRVDEVAGGKTQKGRVVRFQTTGLVAWWKLDEAKGNKAEDATGHQYTANVVGRPQWAPNEGRIGGAINLDGKSAFLNCGRSSEFDFRDSMTAAAWIKVREFSKPGQAILTKGDTGWRLQREKETGFVTFRVNTGAEVARGGDTNLICLVSKRKVDDGQWHHVAGVVDGKRVLLYVDGEVEDSAEAKPIAPNSAPVMIGCNANAYERRFNGWIDDVRLYGYGLTAADIKALYQAAGETARAAK